MVLNKYGLLSDDRKRMQFLAALSRLKNNDDFSFFVQVLRQAQESIDTKNRVALSPDLQWGQGAAQFLSDQLSLIEESEALRDALRIQVESKETPRQNGF